MKSPMTCCRMSTGLSLQQRMLLVGVLLAGACGVRAASEPAAEPTEPAPLAGETTTETQAADSRPSSDVPRGVGEAAEPGAGGEIQPGPQQGGEVTALPQVPQPPADPGTGAATPPPRPGNGRLDVGTAEIARGTGRINRALFGRAIERKRGGLLACYNLPLGANPALRGTLVVVLVVEPNGMVGVRLEQDDDLLAAAGVTSCVLQKLREISFADTPPGSELWIRVPLVFRPAR